MKKIKKLKMLGVVVFITIALAFVAATNDGYSRGLFKPQIIKQKHMDNDNLYELLTADETWAGYGGGGPVCVNDTCFKPFASWQGTVRTLPLLNDTSSIVKVITGDWIDTVSHITGKFQGYIRDDDSVTQGTWWATNIYAQGTWNGQFFFSIGKMSGTWKGAGTNGWLIGDRQ